MKSKTALFVVTVVLFGFAFSSCKPAGKSDPVSTTGSDGQPVSTVVPQVGNVKLIDYGSDGHSVSTVVPSENLTSDGAISVSPAPLLVELRRDILEKAGALSIVLNEVKKLTQRLLIAFNTGKTNDEGNIYRWLFNMEQMYQCRIVWVADISHEYSRECGILFAKASKLNKDNAEKRRDDDKGLRDKAKKQLGEITGEQHAPWPERLEWDSKAHKADYVRISDEQGRKFLILLNGLNDITTRADNDWDELVTCVEADTTRAPGDPYD
jgi:hypothetical protein